MLFRFENAWRNNVTVGLFLEIWRAKKKTRREIDDIQLKQSTCQYWDHSNEFRKLKLVCILVDNSEIAGLSLLPIIVMWIKQTHTHTDMKFKMRSKMAERCPRMDVIDIQTNRYFYYNCNGTIWSFLGSKKHSNASNIENN